MQMPYVRGGVEGGSVIPNGNVVRSPFVAYLQVVVFGYVAEEVVQKVRRLLGMKLDYARGEANNIMVGLRGPNIVVFRRIRLTFC